MQRQSGNMEDITLRVLRILREVDYIAAEDTRHTLKLLNHYGITKPLVSYHQHNQQKRGQYIIELLEQGNDVAVVSDSGMPAYPIQGHSWLHWLVKGAFTLRWFRAPRPVCLRWSCQV